MRAFLIKNYVLICLAGKPQKAVINSSPEGLYRNKYNLTWTVKSLEPLTEVRLLFRMMVSSSSLIICMNVLNSYDFDIFLSSSMYFAIKYLNVGWNQYNFYFYQYHKQTLYKKLTSLMGSSRAFNNVTSAYLSI